MRAISPSPAPKHRVESRMQHTQTSRRLREQTTTRLPNNSLECPHSSLASEFRVRHCPRRPEEMGTVLVVELHLRDGSDAFPPIYLMCRAWRPRHWLEPDHLSSET